MNKETLLRELQNAAIADIILEGDSQTPPFHIQTIITADGYHFNLQTGEKNHPEYEKELAAFTEKVSQTTYDSTFSFRPKYLGHDEMQHIVAAHAKEIKANGGNANNTYRNDEYIIRIGEDLSKLRR